MKMFKSARVMVAILLVFMLVLTACGGTKTNSEASAPAETTAASAEPEVAAVSTDPFGKYEPAIDLTVGRSTNAHFKFIEGETFDNNIWITEYKEKLGINIKHEFLVDEAQYDAKVNVTIASGAIPDIMMVTAKQTKMLMDADLIHEVTDSFSQYSSELSKKCITSDAKLYAASKIEGKLMGVPMLWALDFAFNVLWIRTDWMNKLGLSEPKTFDDFIKIADAFTTQDPDGNGKADTYGFPMTKTLQAGTGDARGLFNMMHAYKGIWLKDASGKLVYSGIQPEMKAALQKMNDLYKKKIIDNEFGVKDEGKIAQDVAGEKVGIEVGAFWNPAWPLNDVKVKKADSDWNAYMLPSVDDKTALSQANVKVDQFFVISKKCKNPEALTKLLNINLENLFGANMEEWDKIELSDKYEKGTIQTFKYAVIGMEPPTHNRDLYAEIQSYMETKDESKVRLAIDDLNKGKAFLAGDNAGWMNWKIRWDNKNGGMAITKKIIDDGTLQFNEFFGQPGPVMVEKLASMDALELEVYTKIIMGAAPIDEFDKFAEQWKKIGGDEVTKEINDWYAKNKQ